MGVLKHYGLKKVGDNFFIDLSWKIYKNSFHK